MIEMRSSVVNVRLLRSIGCGCHPFPVLSPKRATQVRTSASGQGIGDATGFTFFAFLAALDANGSLPTLASGRSTPRTPRRERFLYHRPLSALLAHENSSSARRTSHSLVPSSLGVVVAHPAPPEDRRGVSLSKSCCVILDMAPSVPTDRDRRQGLAA